MQTIQLNLTPCGVPPTIYASMYDIGRIFEFEIYEDAASLSIPTNATVVMRGMKPDHHAFVYSTKDDTPNVSFSGNVVTVTSTEQMTAEPGRTVCELIIEHENTILATLNFFLDVEQAAMPDDADTSASDLMMYQDMVDRTHASEVAAAKSASESESIRQATDALRQKTFEYWNRGFRIKEEVIKHDGWTGDNPPFTYDMGAEYENYAMIIALSETATTAQIKDVSKANIVGKADSRFLYAKKSIPASDIPVTVFYLQDKEGEA